MTATAAKENALLELLEFGPVTLHSSLDVDSFLKVASRYPDIRMEREKSGKVIIMSPIKKGSGRREMKVSGFLFLWHLQSKSGEIYSPSTGFKLPDGAFKSPDCAWVSDERLEKLSDNADEEFIEIAPDFVVEIRSSSDTLKGCKEKMKDVWMANGTKLGWLIDPYSEKVWIYREGQKTEVLEGFKGKKLTGEDLMPGMELPLDEMMIKK